MAIKISKFPYLAVLVGRAQADPIAEMLKRVAPRTNYVYKRVKEFREALRLMDEGRDLGWNRTVVVLCGLSEKEILTAIYQIKHCQQSSRIIVCATRIEEDGRFPLHCVEAGACDYLVFNTYDPMMLEQRIMRALQSEDPYVPYPSFVSFRELKSFSVFVATPFAPPASDDYISAVKVALERLGISEQRADDERLCTFLLAGITSQIENNTVVMGNITSYGLPANANVYLEIGYAIAAKKKVILLRRKVRSSASNDLRAPETPSPGRLVIASNQAVSEGIPADIQGIERVEYSNCADLALQLYFGFRDLPAVAKRPNR